MNNLEIIILSVFLVCTTTLLSFIFMFMFWYNGVLEVNSDDTGDNLKLNINEYEMIKKKLFMIILIKRKH